MVVLQLLSDYCDADGDDRAEWRDKREQERKRERVWNLIAAAQRRRFFFLVFFTSAGPISRTIV